MPWREVRERVVLFEGLVIMFFIIGIVSLILIQMQFRVWEKRIIKIDNHITIHESKTHYGW